MPGDNNAIGPEAPRRHLIKAPHRSEDKRKREPAGSRFLQSCNHQVMLMVVCMTVLSVVTVLAFAW